MLPVLAQGGAETSREISLCWSLEEPGKMGSTFLSRKKQRLPRRSGAPRWRAPGQERAPGWETRRRVTGLGPTANPGGHCSAVTRGPRTQLSRAHGGLLERKPSAAHELGLVSTEACRASRTSTWVLLPKGKRRDLHSSPPYRVSQYPVPSPQELSDTPRGAHPRTGSLRKEVEWTRENEIGVKRKGDSSLQQLGRARKRERAKRIKAG